MVELMVVIAILAILSMIAIPSFNQLIASNRITTVTNDLFGSLQEAKSEAIRRGIRVTLCPSINGTSCQSTTPTWTVGWITFVDDTRVTDPIVDSGEAVLKIIQSISDGVIIKGSTDYASFSPDGTAKLINGGFLNTTIRVCHPSTSLTNDSRARDIRVLRTGRIFITKPPGIVSSCPAPGAPT